MRDGRGFVGRSRGRALPDRRSIERGLDGLVRANRFTIAVVFPLVGAVLLVASAEGRLPDPLAFNAALVLLGTAVMRLPLLAGIAPLVTRRFALALLGLVGYTYTVEAVGLATGLPYGEFAYLESLGPMVAGVPLALPLFFLPLVLDAYLLATLLLPARAGRWLGRIPLAVAGVLAIDLVLDPAAVAIGFWTYAAGGPYYGVPLSNYAGWLLSGTVAVVVVDHAISRPALRARLDSCEFALDDLVSFALLWGAINAFYGNWLPVAATGLLVLGLVRSGRFDVPLPGRREAAAGRARGG